MSGGTLVQRDAHGRRVIERDRFGGEIARLSWTAEGRLAGAAVRVADGGWVRVAPRAAHDPRWGASDALLADDVALTHFAAVDWHAVDAIPVLAEPARLPPGAGTAVLNLLAALATDQARDTLAYRGPYPTEQLFLALLESFRWREDVEDPLGAFVRGGLTWAPAPHARAFAPGGVYVQSRERVEKVAWRGRAYWRRDWQGVERHAAHRVRDVDGRVVCSLWALDTALEDHLVLTADGAVLEARDVPAGDAPARPLPAVVAAGLLAVVVASSAPPLAEPLYAVGRELTFDWAPLAGDLATLGGAAARVSWRLRRALAERVAAAPGRVEQVRLGFAALTELAHALGDALRRRAQARLAAASTAEQAAALAGRRGPDAAAAAARIGEAVEALLADAAQLNA